MNPFTPQIAFLTLIVFVIFTPSTQCQWINKGINTSYTLTGVDFHTKDIGFVCGRNVVFGTSNGGNDWEQAYTADDLVFFEDVVTINQNITLAVGKDFDNDRTVIYRTENGGLDWKKAEVSSSSFLVSVFFPSQDIGYCVGGEGTILKTQDSGRSWTRKESGTGSTLQSVFFINEEIGFVVGGGPINALILKTTDGGDTWSTIESPSANYLQSVYFTNADTGYVVGWNGEIMKTTNCGAEWINQTSVSMSGNLEIEFTNSQTGYIVGGSRDESLIQKTSNGGDLWEDISPASNEGLISIHFPDSRTGFAVGTHGTVLKTENGGVTSVNFPSVGGQFTPYPNPVLDELFLLGKVVLKIDRIHIYNQAGTLLMKQSDLINGSISNFRNLSPGVYYLRIESNGMSEMHKIVKK